MAGAEGIAWATATLLVLLVAIVVGELLLAGRRRQQSGDPSQTDTKGRLDPAWASGRLTHWRVKRRPDLGRTALSAAWPGSAPTAA